MLTPRPLCPITSHFCLIPQPPSNVYYPLHVCLYLKFSFKFFFKSSILFKMSQLLLSTKKKQNLSNSESLQFFFSYFFVICIISDPRLCYLLLHHFEFKKNALLRRRKSANSNQMSCVTKEKDFNSVTKVSNIFLLFDLFHITTWISLEITHLFQKLLHTFEKKAKDPNLSAITMLLQIGNHFKATKKVIG